LIKKSLKLSKLHDFYSHSSGCSFCEEYVGSELTIDHFQPENQGGDNSLSNLVYCCFACNSFKADYWPEDESQRLLHPLSGDIGSHLRQEVGGFLISLTETGARQIERLHLNRARLVRHRLLLQERQRDLWVRQEIQRSLTQIDQRLQRLERQSRSEP
jgi:HNH endonuclease